MTSLQNSRGVFHKPPDIADRTKEYGAQHVVASFGRRLLQERALEAEQEAHHLRKLFIHSPFFPKEHSFYLIERPARERGAVHGDAFLRLGQRYGIPSFAMIRDVVLVGIEEMEVIPEFYD